MKKVIVIVLIICCVVSNVSEVSSTPSLTTDKNDIKLGIPITFIANDLEISTYYTLYIAHVRGTEFFVNGSTTTDTKTIRFKIVIDDFLLENTIVEIQLRSSNGKILLSSLFMEVVPMLSPRIFDMFAGIFPLIFLFTIILGVFGMIARAARVTRATEGIFDDSLVVEEARKQNMDDTLSRAQAITKRNRPPTTGEYLKNTGKVMKTITAINGDLHKGLIHPVFKGKTISDGYRIGDSLKYEGIPRNNLLLKNAGVMEILDNNKKQILVVSNKPEPIIQEKKINIDVKCGICWGEIKINQKIAVCPHCKEVYHEEHALEYSKMKGTCANCKEEWKLFK